MFFKHINCNAELVGSILGKKVFHQRCHCYEQDKHNNIKQFRTHAPFPVRFHLILNATSRLFIFKSSCH